MMDGIMLTFFLDGEDAVPVLAPDEGMFHITTKNQETRYSITTIEQTLIYLTHLRYPRVSDGEVVYRGEPLGVAGSNEYWSQSIGMEVVPLDLRAPIMIVAQDAFDHSITHLHPDEFECGVVDGHVYRSGNFGAVNFPRGTLVRNRWSERVYRVERDGIRREVHGSLEACALIAAIPLVIVSEAALTCLRASYEPVTAEAICAEDVDRPFGNGTILRVGSMTQEWVVDGRYLRPIANHGAFLLMGYEEGSVREVSTDTLRYGYHFAIDDPWRVTDATFCATGEPFPEAPL